MDTSQYTELERIKIKISRPISRGNGSVRGLLK